MQVIGKMKQLLGSHGDVDVERAVGAIAMLTELTAIDIAEINKASEQGGIYIAKDGEIFDNFDSRADSSAMFKMVPTGLKSKFNNTPLVASFVKSKGTWIGVLIDIPEKIFREYKRHYGHGGFNDTYTELFCGDNRQNDITGFGLNGMLNIEVDDDTDENLITPETELENLKNALDKAQKCLLDKSMTKSKKKKAEDKVANIKKQIEAIESKIESEKPSAEVVEETSEIPYEVHEEILEALEPTEETSETCTSAEEPEETTYETESEILCVSEEHEDETNNDESLKWISTDVSEEQQSNTLEISDEVNVSTEFSTEQEQGVESKTVDTDMADTSETSETSETADSTEISETPVEDEPAEEEYESTRDAIKRIKAARRSSSSKSKKTTTPEIIEESPVEEVIEPKIVTEPAVAFDIGAELSNTDTVERVPIETYDRELEREMWSEIGEDVSDEEVKLMSGFVTDLYNSLLDKENWKANNGKPLLEYIKGLIACVENYKKRYRKGTNGFAMSENGKKLLVNTGLIDTYGNFIYVIDHTASTAFGQFKKKVLTIAKSKSSLLDEGFSLETVKSLPKKFKFVEDKKELIFDSTIDEFDLIDTEHLNHIINERRSRFPKKYANENCKNLADKIKISIEQAIELQEADYKYIVPMYNLTTQEIEFLIPLHLDTTYGQKPELCIIIARKNNLWKIFTIISADLAYCNARLIAKVNKVWSS